MQKFVEQPVTMGDVLVDTAADLFSRTELKGVTLPKDVFCGDILSKATLELFKAGDADPIICLSDRSAGEKKTIRIVDRHVVITDFRLTAADAAAKKEALTQLTASGSIRLATNADFYKA
ncbi:hypothetical protein V1447_004667 [Serratia marcescens]|nr:hypothetical protein [Serratia marcescens]EME9756054.1 hypothetical protein [Serratia marcescens]